MSELLHSDVLDALAAWEGQEVGVIVLGVEGDRVHDHPVAILVGELGGVEMSLRADDEGRSWGVAAYRVGSFGRFGMDQGAYIDAEWRSPESLHVWTGGCIVIIECPPSDSVSPGGLGRETD